MTTIIVFLVLAALAFAVKTQPHWRKWWYRKDIHVAKPEKLRKDLRFGYYSCKGEQVAETKGHVNLLHESQFDGPEKCIQNILDCGQATVLDVHYQLFSQESKEVPNKVRPDAESRLRDFFALLSARGALGYVKYLYPIDEPNNTVVDLDELTKAVELVRRVAAEFRELDGYKMAVIYAADKGFTGQHLYDVVGYDDYDIKSTQLVSKKFKDLLASLLPHQTIILVPGGAYRQDPTPFMNYANTNPKVEIVMPFLWFDDTTGSVGAPGIRSNGMAAGYAKAGSEQCAAGRAQP